MLDFFVQGECYIGGCGYDWAFGAIDGGPVGDLEGVSGVQVQVVEGVSGFEPGGGFYGEFKGLCEVGGGDAGVVFVVCGYDFFAGEEVGALACETAGVVVLGEAGHFGGAYGVGVQGSLAEDDALWAQVDDALAVFFEDAVDGVGGVACIGRVVEGYDLETESAVVGQVCVHVDEVLFEVDSGDGSGVFVVCEFEGETGGSERFANEVCVQDVGIGLTQMSKGAVEVQAV